MPRPGSSSDLRMGEHTVNERVLLARPQSLKGSTAPKTRVHGAQPPPPYQSPQVRREHVVGPLQQQVGVAPQAGHEGGGEAAAGGLGDLMKGGGDEEGGTGVLACVFDTWWDVRGVLATRREG
jgi:hypothetical protein